jgi:iron-sulfur cluster assembly accessory protein
MNMPSNSTQSDTTPELQLCGTIKLSRKASDFMRRMVRFGGAGSAAGFRLSVKPGGCSGLQSDFSIESAAYPGDKVLEFGNLSVFVPEASFQLLEGAVIDFLDSATQTGLTFLTPDKGSCGCATTGAGPLQLSKL